jgi:hypothetical protein
LTEQAAQLGQGALFWRGGILAAFGRDQYDRAMGNQYNGGGWGYGGGGGAGMRGY